MLKFYFGRIKSHLTDRMDRWGTLIHDGPWPSPSGLDNCPTGSNWPMQRARCSPLDSNYFWIFLCDGFVEKFQRLIIYQYISSSFAPFMALQDLKSGVYPIFGQTYAAASVQDRSWGRNVHTRSVSFLKRPRSKREATERYSDSKSKLDVK